MELSKNKHKSIKFIIVTILLTFILYSYICLVLLPKKSTDAGGARYYRGRGFVAEPKNTLDIMVFGNSDVYSGFSPATLFEKYGYTSYASGVALQNITQINRLFDSMLETQKPKVILLDVDCLYGKASSSIDSTSFYISPLTFHSRWKDIKLRDFYTIPNRRTTYDLTKGFVSSHEVFVTYNKNYMGPKNSEPKPVKPKNYRSLMSLIEKCKDKDIKLIFMELPSASSWNYKKHNYIDNIAKKHDITFLDLNEKSSKYSIDFEKDFRDNGNHLNSIGAEKATKFVGKYLHENFSHVLYDKRERVEYAYWNKVVDYYHAKHRMEI